MDEYTLLQINTADIFSMSQIVIEKDANFNSNF